VSTIHHKLNRRGALFPEGCYIFPKLLGLSLQVSIIIIIIIIIKILTVIIIVQFSSKYA
jgi:hypothetical protein